MTDERSPTDETPMPTWLRAMQIEARRRAAAVRRRRRAAQKRSTRVKEEVT